jgi:tetratricopeptide (TPR) repeat protein
MNQPASPAGFLQQLGAVFAEANAAIGQGDLAAALSLAAQARGLLQTADPLLTCIEFLAAGETGVGDALAAADNVLSVYPHEPTAAAAKASALAALGQWADLAQSIDQLLPDIPAAQKAQRLKVQAVWHTVGAEAALGELDKAELTEPDDIYLRAQLLDALGRSDEALAQVERALTLDPVNVGFILGQAELLWKIGRADDSLAALDAGLNADSGSWALWAARAERRRLLGRYDVALQDIDRALELEKTAYSYGTRGQILVALDRAEEAALAFDRGAELDPRVGWLQADRGENLRGLGRLAEALSALDAAVELTPDSVYAQGTRGQTLRQLGRNSEALASLQLAAGLAERNNTPTPWVVEELAAAFNELNRYQEALDTLDHLGTPLSFFGQALHTELLKNLGRSRDAVEEADRLLQGRPEITDSLLVIKAQALIDLGQPVAALSAIEEAQAMQPGAPWISAVRVIVLSRLERYHDALGVLEADVLPEAPGNDWALAAKGGLLSGIGQYEQARDFLVAAVADGAEHPQCQGQLGSALLSLGQLAAAIEAYEKALSIPREDSDLWWLTDLGDARSQQAGTVSPQAREAFEQGAELAAGRSADNPEILTEGGWCLFRLGRADAAIDRYRTAISNSEINPWASIELSLVLLAVGQTGEATGVLDAVRPVLDGLADGDRRRALLAEGTRLLGSLRADGTLRDVDHGDVDLLAQRLREQLVAERGTE